MIPVPDIINEKARHPVVVVDEHVDVAVVVDVAERSAPSDIRQREHRSSFIGDRLEPPVSVTANQLHVLPQW